MLLREISVEILPEVISEEFCFYLDQEYEKNCDQ